MGAKILVVEDDTDIRSSIMELLQTEGYGVVGANDGQEALEQLQAHPDTALIMLDLAMPIMNGWQFRQLQLEDPKIAHIPILVLTAQPKLVIIGGGVQLKACGILHKPTDVDRLLALVEWCLGEHGTH